MTCAVVLRRIATPPLGLRLLAAAKTWARGSARKPRCVSWNVYAYRRLSRSLCVVVDCGQIAWTLLTIANVLQSVETHENDSSVWLL